VTPVDRPNDGPPEPHRPRWADVKAALDAAGFHPSRRLGQNFLLDENMVARIAADAGLIAGDFVLEVGAGCGFLTAHLAALGVELVSVEIDRRLFEIASRFVEPWPAAKVLRADILSGKHALAPEVEALLPRNRPWHLVGNLPYSIASPLLVVLARQPRAPRSMTALVQAEVADRVAAHPGGGAFGPLTVRLQALYRATRIRTVGPALFWPRPKVDSAVVRLDRRSAAEGSVEPDAGRLAALDALVDVVFGQRRKALAGRLARSLGDRRAAEDLLERCGVAPGARAEALDLATLWTLADSPEWKGRTKS
jgi:16S rRNA (adenine1518-N6/adenine1519-N6)-dimethyltransferase